MLALHLLVSNPLSCLFALVSSNVSVAAKENVKETHLINIVAVLRMQTLVKRIQANAFQCVFSNFCAFQE